jgi:hypothetical protein
VKLAQASGLAAGRKMRVDTTVVETNVHYPTDSSLLGDGVRVLIRTMKGVGKIVGEAGTKLCDRGRSVKLRVLDIAPCYGKAGRAIGAYLLHYRSGSSRPAGQPRRVLPCAPHRPQSRKHPILRRKVANSYSRGDCGRGVEFEDPGCAQVRALRYRLGFDMLKMIFSP